MEFASGKPKALQKKVYEKHFCVLYEFSSVTIQIKSTQQIYAVQYSNKKIYIYTVKEKDEKLKQNTVFTLPSQ